MAPASIASRTSFFIAAISSAVAARSVDSSPMTYRRSGVWPNRAATLIAEPRFSSASRYCGKVSNGQFMPRPASRASRLMPSTFSSVCMISLRWIALVGATPKPQLPITVVVTPCQGEMLSMRSHRIWAS